MKLMKKITALLLACTLAMSSGASAFAVTEAPSAAGTETTIIDPNTQESERTESDKDVQQDDKIDVSDTSYVPIDLTGYIKWNGISPLISGRNYYVGDDLKLNKSITVPKDTALVITKGNEIIIQSKGTLNVKGTIITEPNSDICIVGKLRFYPESAFDCYGRIRSTKSSILQIQSDFMIRDSAKATFSGNLNVYKDGVYINYGQTALSQNAKMLVTGDFQTPVGGTFTNRGYFGVTTSGKSSISGKFILYGETIISGVFIFEETVKYFRVENSRFAVTPSSELIDYRYLRPSGNSGSGGNGANSNIKGIDVSYAQDRIDWRKVKLSGIDFAMIRASRGYINEEKPMTVDTTFKYNITQASKYIKNVGVYHYLYADTVEEAVAEARFFIKTIEPYDITYPVVLDVEEQYQANLGKEKLTAMCKAFLDELKKNGYYGMIYANKTWLTNYLDMSKLSEYDVWLAQWNSVPTYLGSFGMWQYSSKGLVSGIDGYVDLNISYKDYAKIIREGGYNNLNKNKGETNAA